MLAATNKASLKAAFAKATTSPSKARAAAEADAERSAARIEMVACVLHSGTTVVINAMTGMVEARLAEDAEDGTTVAPTTVDGTATEAADSDGSDVDGRLAAAGGKRKRKSTNGVAVALYDGFGLSGLSTRPLAVVLLGSGPDQRAVAWDFYGQRVAWEKDLPTAGLTGFRCVSRQLVLTTHEGVTVLHAVTGLLAWQVEPQRDPLVANHMVVTRTLAPPQPKPSQLFYPGTVRLEGMMFGAASGAQYSLSVKARQQPWGGVTLLQVGAAYGHDFDQDENPDNPSFHPPAGGGLAAVLSTSYAKFMWTYHRWVHTKATKLHEVKTLARFCIAMAIWLLQVLQLSYMPLRAELPPVMSPWRRLAEISVTLGVSRFDGSDAFAPAYWAMFALASFMLVMATCQAWLAEWVLRSPRSSFRRAFWEVVVVIGMLSHTLLLLPVFRMLLAPWVTNVPVRRVAAEMRHDQILWVPLPQVHQINDEIITWASITQGRDVRKDTGTHTAFVLYSIVIVLLLLPLMVRLIGVQGDWTLLRFSRKFMSAVGGWNQDDSHLALEQRYGREHSLSMRSRRVGSLFMLLKLVLLLNAMAGLPPAWEFFLCLVLMGLVYVLLTTWSMFHDTLANVALRSLAAMCVFLCVVAWLGSLQPRPVGKEGRAKDGLIGFIVVVGVPASIAAVWLEDTLRQKLFNSKPCFVFFKDKIKAWRHRAARARAQRRRLARLGSNSGSQVSGRSRGVGGGDDAGGGVGVAAGGGGGATDRTAARFSQLESFRADGSAAGSVRHRQSTGRTLGNDSGAPSSRARSGQAARESGASRATSGTQGTRVSRASGVSRASRVSRVSRASRTSRATGVSRRLGTARRGDGSGIAPISEEEDVSDPHSQRL